MQRNHFKEDSDADFKTAVSKGVVAFAVFLLAMVAYGLILYAATEYPKAYPDQTLTVKK